MKEQLKQLDSYLLKPQFNHYGVLGVISITTFTLPGLLLGSAFLVLSWRSR